MKAFERRWLSEVVRLREERDGALPDADAVAAARRAGGDAEARVLARAETLAQDLGFVDRLTPWRGRAQLVLAGCAIAALVSGFGAALAVLGDGSRAVNVVWALGALLGLHLLSLLLWFAGLSAGGRGGGVARAWFWLADRTAGSGAVDVGKALISMLARARLLRWWFGSVTHGLWAIALVGAVIGLLVTLSARRYGFVWETTILPPGAFIAFVDVIGWLPALVGFAVPDADAVVASGQAAASGDAARTAWASWLLGCVVVYGLMPRLVLWALTYGLWVAGRARVRLDLGLPYYAALLGRLAPESERIGVTDAAPASLPQAHAGMTREARGGAVLVGIELSRVSPWPPALPHGAANAGVVDSREQRKRVLAQLCEAKPSRLLVACDAGLTPDRGTLELVAAMSQHAGECRVWLLGGAGQSERGDYWREGLGGIGLPPSAVVGDGEAALAWLEGGT